MLEDSSFQTDTLAAADRVRSAMRVALTTTGCDLSRPQHVARRLGLDKSLAWKTVRLTTDTDPVLAMTRLPGRSGQRILFEALAAANAPPAALEELHAAIEAFRSLMESQAGTRHAADVLLSQLSPEQTRRLQEQHRHLAFQGNSATWGVQATAQISLHMAAPIPESPDELRLLAVSGLVGLERLRAGTPWAIATLRSYRGNGPAEQPLIDPVDPHLPPDALIPIMQSFCSHTDVAPRTVPRADGSVRLEIAGGPVGRAGSVTCFVGYVMRQPVSRLATATDTVGEHFAQLSTPTFVVYHDVYVHRSMTFAMEPCAALYSQLPGGPRFPLDGPDAARLPLGEPVVRMGPALPGTTPEFERHHELVELGARALKYNASDFVGFRVRIAFPPIPTMIVMRYPLAQQ